MDALSSVFQVAFFSGFIVAFFIDHLPLSFRIVGHQVGAFPESTLRSSQVMIMNRFGAAFFFASAGFLVDIGLPPLDFLRLFALSWGTLGLLTLLYVKHWRSMSALIATRFLSQALKSPTTLVDFTSRDLLTNFPFVFNLIGISMPVMAAAFFPDFRGALLQTGFIFNSVATLLLVFVIEPKFIGHIGANEVDAADSYHQRLVFSKAVILLFFCVVSFGLTLFIESGL